MASKKQLHRKSRIPGIISDRRLQNQFNLKILKELQKGIGILHHIWKRKPKPVKIKIQHVKNHVPVAQNIELNLKTWIKPEKKIKGLNCKQRRNIKRNETKRKNTSISTKS